MDRRISQVLVAASVVVCLATTAGPSGAAYLRPGQVERVSVSSSGAQAIDPTAPVIGSTSTMDTALNVSGRYVAFTSGAANLVPGDANGVPDVFVHDRKTGETNIVSVASDGTIGRTGVGACVGSPNLIGSFAPSISSNGRLIVFHSCAINLVPGDTNLASDVFVHDMMTSRTQRVSLSSSGDQASAIGTPLYSFAGGISPEGRFVSFSILPRTS